MSASSISDPRSSPTAVVGAYRRPPRRQRGWWVGSLAVATLVALGTVYYLNEQSTFGTLPCGPGGQFGAVLGISSIGGTEAFVNVSYQFGCSLSAKEATLNLTSTLHPAIFLCGHAGGAGDPYNESVGGVRGGFWTAGQVWSLHLVGGPGGTVCGSPPDLSSCGDNVTVTIRNAEMAGTVLFQVTLPGLVPISGCP
ncbi:MAG: hypothetical protein KGJ23_10100 [Euryarchaeota archaeon]|nr:hypothetical protein [Euryarchaeota archaeon]MDE1836956.1 hypothetical protein [Euryarchaeota archaeon]MDE1881930.1 hypothetical protein [Euryarchaeota archaeon]MDE2045859.1 hypothetical protein [Thermoplasmata archaeon]